jgi:hypothetical protein
LITTVGGHSRLELQKQDSKVKEEIQGGQQEKVERQG